MNVYVLYNNGKLRAVYSDQHDAAYDLQILTDKGYKSARVQQVQVQNQPREAEPIDAETRAALQQMVERI